MGRASVLICRAGEDTRHAEGVTLESCLRGKRLAFRLTLACEV